MTHYQIPSPRKVFAVGAVAMTVITLCLSVIVPAQVHPGDRDPRAMTGSTVVAPAAAAEVVADRLRVEVVGVREPELISVDVRNASPKRKQDS